MPLSRRRPRHPWLATAGLLIAALLLIEVGVRSIEDQLPIVRAGDEAEMVLKAKRIEEIGTIDPSVDVVVFGTSMMDSAMNPREYLGNSARSGSIYNASVVGAPVSTQVRWANEIVLDRLDPGTVVLGVHPIDLLLVDVFNLNIQANQSDVIFGTVERELRTGMAGEVDRWSHTNLASIRQRGSLRRPGVATDAMWSAVTRTPPKKYIPKRDEAYWSKHLSDLGESSLYLGAEFKITSVADQLKQNMVPEGFYVNDLYRLLDVVTSAETPSPRVVLVIPPVPIDAWVQLGVDLSVLRQGQDLIAAVARHYGVQLMDFTDRPYENELFADIVHMNDRGAERFSRELALLLNG